MSSPYGSDRQCNVIFTCFCKLYLFLFPIQHECSLVKCHCSIFIKLASATIGKRTKRVLRHRAKLGQRDKSTQPETTPAGIKQSKKLRNLFKLNWIKAEAIRNDNCSKLSASDLHESKLGIGQWANFVTASEQKAIKAIFTVFTLKFKTFDVVLNTWLQKSDVHSELWECEFW